jgi:hypothetical protein
MPGRSELFEIYLHKCSCWRTPAPMVRPAVRSLFPRAGMAAAFIRRYPCHPKPMNVGTHSQATAPALLMSASAADCVPFVLYPNQAPKARREQLIIVQNQNWNLAPVEGRFPPCFMRTVRA